MEAIATPATGYYLLDQSERQVHNEPGNVCIKRVQKAEKGEADLQELPLMLTELGVEAVLGNWPMSAGWFTAASSDAENQDTHESRSGSHREQRWEPLCAIR